jgi:type IV secretion system protein VirD4
MYGGLALWVGRYVFRDLKQYNQRRAAEQAQLGHQQAEQLARWRREAPDREKSINESYKDKMRILTYDSTLITETDQIKEMNDLWKKEMYVNVTMSLRFVLSRAFTSMKESELEICRYLELFRSYELITNELYCQIWVGFVYNGGNCQQQVFDYFISRGFQDKHSIKNASDAVRYVINRWNAGSMEVSKALFLRTFATIEGQFPDHHIVREFRPKLVAGSNWHSEQDMARSIFSEFSGDYGGLFLGAADSGRPIGFREQGSLISIAPPGSGKTQCHVLTNLLTYQGPVVVLDVKGECYEKTAAWRKRHVGPVFKFSPLDPDSNHYNPLAFVPNDPDLIWEECRLMADLLIVPENLHDPSWEERARDVVAGAIAWLVRKKDVPEEQRSMGKIVDVVSKVGWTDFIAAAKDAHMVPPLRRVGNALADMPDVTLGGVLSAARRHLKVWEGARVEKVTKGCDWKPEDLRNGKNPTIYICIPPNEIESYAPLLRVLFAQHLRVLMRELPKDPGPPILFMLDELPRLGHMPPVTEALEVGRQYGIKLWMFAQSLGQLTNAYRNAEGMIGSCAVRIFMNPSAHDGTAKRLSEELGYVESIIDGSRRLMIEPTELAGPEYKDYQVVLGTNEKPLKLKKIYAHSVPVLKERMALREHMGSALEAGS